jgi:hypothetical protein
MKRYVIIILCGLLAIATLDQIAGRAIDKLYQKATTGYQGRLNRIVSSTDAPIVVFGSSWALHHYVPQVISDSTRLAVMNGGFEGQGITTNYAIVRTLTQRYQPELIIYDLNPHYDVNLNPGTASFARVRTLTQLECRDSLLLSRDPWERVRMLSRIFPYNSSLLEFVMSGFSSNSIYDNPEQDNGYIPQHHTLKAGATAPDIHESSHVDETKIDLLTDLMTRYKGRIIFFTSPSFNVRHELDEACLRVKAVAKMHGVPYYDMRNDSTLVGKPEFWDDYDHLNDTGARLYSARVATIVASHLMHGTERIP